MHIFISVDIEGVAGVNSRSQCHPGNPEYENARRLMTEEANAAIRGAFEGGATEVTVADSHGPMQNMIADALDPRARVISGTPRRLSMVEGLHAGHAGLVLIGWHAAAGNRGVQAHTVSGQAFSRIDVNGIRAGEVTLFGGHAAELGVPLLVVTGDDQLAEEMADQYPNADAVVVKRALGGTASDSLSPSRSREEIQSRVSRGVTLAAGRPVECPCKAPLSVELTLVRQQYADAAQLIPGVVRKGGCDIEFEASTHADAIGIISLLAIVSAGLS